MTSVWNFGTLRHRYHVAKNITDHCSTVYSLDVHSIDNLDHLVEIYNHRYNLNCQTGTVKDNTALHSVAQHLGLITLIH